MSKKNAAAAPPLTFIRLTDTLCLVENPMPSQAAPVKRESPLNHVFIRDRSGSMYSESPRLTNDLKAHFRRTLKQGDTVTLGWFSGKGQCGFTVKGFHINGAPGGTALEEQFQQLDKYLDAGTPVIGMTCFSESLREFAQVVKDLAPNGNPTTLTFLTDGYPTVYPAEAELKAIDSLTRDTGALVHSALVVGYGPFYNVELLSQMAQNMGGSVVRSAELKDFAPAYMDFTQKARGAPGRVMVPLQVLPEQSLGIVFTVDGSEVRNYNVEHSGAFGPCAYADPSDAALWVITTEPKNGKEVGATSRSKLEPAQQRALYGAAVALSQRMRADLALETLGKLGDVALIKAFSNAFTNDEFSAAEALTASAMGNPDKRFRDGVKRGFLPARDAFCLVDLINLLTNDDEAYFLPYHSAFDYRRIGPPRKKLPGYPDFKPDDGVKTPFNSIVMHDTHLNLSFNTVITGTIDLPDAAPDGTLRPQLPDGVGAMRWKTSIWRTFALVRDGFLNVKKLPVTLGLDTFRKLVDEGVISKNQLAQDGASYGWAKDATYVLDLTKVPIMNRAMADGLDSAQKLALDTIDETRTMGILKALRDYRKQLEPERAMEARFQLTAEQEKYIKALGIKSDGVYNPPTDRSEVTDFYMAKTFAIKVEGESLPSIKEVQKRLDAGKALNLGAESVAAGITLGKGLDLQGIKQAIQEHTNKLKRVRASIQAAKFAVLLGQRWPREFKSRLPDDCKLDIKAPWGKLPSVKVTFVLDQEQVDF